jgi:hypothetical protein
MIRKILFGVALAATATSVGCMGPDLFARSGSGQRLPASRGEAWGYIDVLGLVVVPFHFSDAQPYSEGLAAVALGKKYGYIDEGGVLVIKPQYDAAGAFKEGLAPVRRNEQWTFVTPEGKEFPDASWTWAEEFHEGLAAVRDRTDKWGYVDRTGKLVVPASFDRVEPFSEGLGCVHREGHVAYVNATGKTVLTSATWTRGNRFAETLAAVEIGGAWGYIDRTGAVAIRPQFEGAGEFSQGLAPVRIRGKSGYIDRTGKVAIEPRFDWAWTFSEGLACVTDSKRRCGYIDPTGREVIRPQFDEATAFSQGQARVRIEDQWSYVRPNGVIVWSPLDYEEWDKIEEISLERKPGLGFTESYTVTFKSDGTARFQASGEGKRTGLFEGTVHPEAFARLAKFFQSHGFFAMKEWYPVRVDYPTATLRVTRSGKTGSVQADDAGGPTAWWAMVMAVDGLSSRVDWKKK